MDQIRLENVAEKQAESKPVLMKCGCVAHATCSRRNGVDYNPPIPSCFVHDCDEVADEKPSLEGRMARCDYFGSVGRNYGPIYGGGKCSRGKCECLVPSSYELPFFKFKGAGSPTALETCKCGRIEKLHWPLWEARFKVVRRWYKIERHEAIETEKKNLPTITRASECDWVALWTEYERERWMKMGSGLSLTGDTSEPTKVYSVDLLDVKQVPTPREWKVCGNFTTAGAAQFDNFFCGCHGWD